jgi:hypothetical protein
VTKKFESKYKELQLDNKALEESCSVLASQIETLMTENMNDKDSGMHNNRMHNSQRSTTTTTNFQEEGKAILNTVASQLSVGLNQVTSNVSIETQNKKIEERKALNIVCSSLL